LNLSDFVLKKGSSFGIYADEVKTYQHQ